MCYSPNIAIDGGKENDPPAVIKIAEKFIRRFY